MLAKSHLHWMRFCCLILLAAAAASSRDAYGQRPANSRSNRYKIVEDLLSLHRFDADVYGPSEVVNEDVNWNYPSSLDKSGQVAGAAVSPDGLLYLFHRNDHVWDASTFDMNDQYLLKDKGPIKQDTVSIVNTSDGRIIGSWGKNRFYMPHGISFDGDGNVWLTDVGLHQVFRFNKGSWDTPNITLGKAFVPGASLQQFCKPTDVAVSSSGLVYISDGYCNSRVLIFDLIKRSVLEIARNENMQVPHSLTLLEKRDLICVADREGGRILCFTAGLKHRGAGDLVYSVERPLLGHVYGIDHSGDILYVINYGVNSINGYSLDIVRRDLQSTWHPLSGFKLPHDITFSPQDKALYVTEISLDAPRKLYKFKLSTRSPMF